MFCEHCGKEIEDGLLFCNYCGAKIEAKEQAQSKEYMEPREPIRSRDVSRKAVKPKKNKKPWIILVCVLICVAIAATAGVLLLGQRGKDTGKNQETQAETENNQVAGKNTQHKITPKLTEAPADQQAQTVSQTPEEPETPEAVSATPEAVETTPESTESQSTDTAEENTQTSVAAAGTPTDLTMDDIHDICADIDAKRNSEFTREGADGEHYFYYDTTQAEGATLRKVLLYPAEDAKGTDYQEFYYVNNKVIFAYVWQSDADAGIGYYYSGGSIIGWRDSADNRSSEVPSDREGEAVGLYVFGMDQLARVY